MRPCVSIVCGTVLASRSRMTGSAPFPARSMRSPPDKIYGASIDALESLVKRSQAIARFWPAPTDVFETVDELQMLNRVRNRTNDYLIMDRPEVMRCAGRSSVEFDSRVVPHPLDPNGDRLPPLRLLTLAQSTVQQ
jgi:hypothetical protein